MATDYTRSPPQILIDLINEDNATNLTLIDITYGVPWALPEGSNRNTGITVTAASNSPYYEGSADLTYNRVDLNRMPRLASRIFHRADAFSAYDLLPIINTAYGVNLTFADVEDDPLPTFTGTVPGETKPFVLRAKPTSLVWRNSVELTIRGGAVDLADILKTTALNGFVYPDAVVPFNQQMLRI